MRRTSRTRWREGAYTAGTVVLALAIVVVLPLLGAAAFVARFALLAAAIVAVAVALVSYLASARFRDWVRAGGEPQVWYKGLRLATDVALAPGHVWARLEDGEAEVGIDDLAQSAFGPVAEVELPELGREVRKGERLFALRRGERALSARAPVSGTVVAVNGLLRDDPERINASPFEAGWAARILGPSRGEKRSLFRGQKAREWFRNEVDRLIAALAGGEAVPTLPDGGPVAGELAQHVGDGEWDALRASFFDGDVPEEGRS